jgi:hypothetical protein
MKRNLCGIILVFMAFAATLVAEDATDTKLGATKPVATALDTEVASVEYVRREGISLKQLKLTITRMESAVGRTMTVDERTKYLDLMINDILFLQYCEQAKLSVTDAELSQAIQQMKNQVLQSLKQNPQGVDQATLNAWTSTGVISDDAFFSVLAKIGVQASDLKLYVKKRLLLQKYLKGKQDQIDAVPMPTYDEISKFYNDNAKTFYRPDAVKLGIIFVDIRGKDDAGKQKAKALAQSLYAKVKDNPTAFNEAVLRANDDSKLGYAATSDYYYGKTADYQKLFGDKFYQAAFALKKGGMSSLLEGDSGYHILLAQEIYPAHQLELTENLSIADKGTVYDYIKQAIYNNKVNKFVDDILGKLVNDIRAKSKIKTKPELLNW